MGILGGILAIPDNLTHLVRTAEKLFGDEYSSSVIGAGRHKLPMGVQAVTMGGNLRVEQEDNIYLRKGELAESNSDLVEKAIDLSDELSGKPIATPDGVREFLGLKGRAERAFA